MQAELDALDVRTPSMEANVSSLSGGNQQKVVLARALLSKPAMLIADEPTQGVDVGARAEIYRIIREVAASGVPVIVASSDAKELEGLCDRVIVMSRGQSVVELTGDDVTEERGSSGPRSARPRSRTVRRPGVKEEVVQVPARTLPAGRLRPGADPRRWSSSGSAPTSTPRTTDTSSAFNITSVLMLVAALGFIAMGQTVALMMAGIDLSVGPLAGLLVVVGVVLPRRWQVRRRSWLLGFLLMLVVAAASGASTESLIRYGRFTPVAATLAMYIALQGLGFVLRDAPGGFIELEPHRTDHDQAGAGARGVHRARPWSPS